VVLSAQTGEGIDDLRRHIADRMTQGSQIHRFDINISDGASLAWLHEHGEVLKTESHDVDQKLIVTARLSDAAYARFMARDR
jgi:GTP-binding protein HflX